MNPKYQSRESRLKNKIAEELSHKTPNLMNILTFVNEFEQANLDTIDKLNRKKKIDDNKIKGALKQTIHAHGPITTDFIGSATKRINGALMLSEGFNCPESTSDKPFSIRGILLGAAIATIVITIINLL